MSRLLTVLLLLAATLMLAPLAQATTVEPNWGGLYDNGDCDDVILLITSAARVHRGPPSVAVHPRANAKCDRCWHYTPDVDGDGLCARCRSNLQGPGERRQHV